jgi:Skp family chaperone for outer membrane proteins
MSVVSELSRIRRELVDLRSTVVTKAYMEAYVDRKEAERHVSNMSEVSELSRIRRELQDLRSTVVTNAYMEAYVDRKEAEISLRILKTKNRIYQVLVCTSSPHSL